MIYTVTLNTAVDKILHLNDVLTRKKNNKIDHITYDIGGKATHVSVVLSQMGIPNIATGFIGEYNQAILISLLENKDVQCEFIVQKGCKTRESTVVVDNSGQGSFMITEAGFEITENSKNRLLDKLKSNVKEKDFVVFAGSPPKNYSIESYTKLLQTVKKNKGRIAIDAAREYLIEAMKLQPFFIKPNEFEFQEIVGKPLNTEQEFVKEMKKILLEGTDLVIVSLGKRGSLVGYKDYFYRVTPPTIKEVNDTGCGDVFVGGLVAKLSENDRNIKEAIRFATAISASKATHHQSSDFCLKQTDELEKQVIIETIGGM